MNKEEAKRELESMELLYKVFKKGINEYDKRIAKLKAIINKKDDWRSVEVSGSWLELLEEKALLMADMMHAFAHVRNEGWVPDWEDHSEHKCGLYARDGEVSCSYAICHNDAVFGIAVKSREIAEEMLAEFGERIKEIYYKQY